MNYRKHLSEPWFSLIKLGIKTVEGRLNKGDFSKMKLGDTITFYNDDFIPREMIVTVKDIKYYRTFREYLENETLNATLPGFTSIEEGVKVYYKYFSKLEEANYNVIALCFN